MPESRRPSDDAKMQTRQVCRAPEAGISGSDLCRFIRIPINFWLRPSSPQCTDARVNLVTPGTVRTFSGRRQPCGAEPGELESLIRSTGFFRAKARNLLAMASQVRRTAWRQNPPKSGRTDQTGRSGPQDRQRLARNRVRHRFRDRRRHACQATGEANGIDDEKDAGADRARFDAD